MFETLLFTQQENIATITFNRPDAMNCFNQKMADELKAVTHEIKKNDQVRAVLLQGSGHLFMAGGDIQFFYKNLPTMPEGILEIVQTLNEAVINLMHMPKPVLASVHGSVAGVGMSLMMACDLVIAAADTKFTMAYSGIGISPDGGASYLLPRLVGTKKAMEWLLLSEVFDATTAQLHGLINWTCPADQLTAQTKKLLDRLAQGPTYSYAKTKRLVNETWNHSLPEQLVDEGEAFIACSISKDFHSGVTHFLNKTKPTFVGE